MRAFGCWFIIAHQHHLDPAYHVCQNLTINNYTWPQSAQDLSALTPALLLYVLFFYLSYHELYVWSTVLFRPK